MASSSFNSFLQAIDEVDALGRASNPQLGRSDPESLRLARAIGRAQIVLLSSHFERYVYAVNEELVSYLNSCRIDGNKFPEKLRLLHSRRAIEQLSETEWTNRAANLTNFIADDGWLWQTGITGTIDHDKIVEWIKSPKPDTLKRYFGYWGVEDIFRKITNKRTTLASLRLSIQALVDLRNNIAHGDIAAQATQQDVKNYLVKAKTFCERADRFLSKHVAKVYLVTPPW